MIQLYKKHPYTGMHPGVRVFCLCALLWNVQSACRRCNPWGHAFEPSGDCRPVIVHLCRYVHLRHSVKIVHFGYASVYKTEVRLINCQAHLAGQQMVDGIGHAASCMSAHHDFDPNLLSTAAGARCRRSFFSAHSGFGVQRGVAALSGSSSESLGCFVHALICHDYSSCVFTATSFG